jgi:hypothetical protein
MIRVIARRAAVVFGGVLMSGVACAADRNEPAVVYRDVGQSRVILPVVRDQAERPYALTGQPAERSADAWERQGHWINAGQARVYVPAAR